MAESDWPQLLDREAAGGVLRLQYSDWLEEQGLLTEAEVQRWLARAARYPNATGIDWEWWQEGAMKYVAFAVPDASHRVLPRGLFAPLPRGGVALRCYGRRAA